MKHAGELVKEVITSRGTNLSLLARRLGRSRQFIYNLFEKERIDNQTLLQLRQELNYPFYELLGNDPGHRTYKGNYLSESEFIDLQEQLELALREKDLWKDKYTALLEQMNRILQERKA